MTENTDTESTDITCNALPTVTDEGHTVHGRDAIAGWLSHSADLPSTADRTA